MNATIDLGDSMGLAVRKDHPGPRLPKRRMAVVFRMPAQRTKERWFVYSFVAAGLIAITYVLIVH